MKINEIFLSIEGEGKRTGLPAVFIRTFGCQLCCPYCDTQYACKGEDYKEMSVDNIVDEVLTYGVNRVTFTGGEPLIQPDADELINRLRVEGIEVNVETNGAVPLMDSAFRSNSYFYTMDWKSISSGMSDKMIPDNLYKLGEQDVLKFVVSTEEDLNQMKDILSQLEKELLSYGAKIEFQVYVSPIFGEIEPKELVEYVLKNHLNNVHVQVQLHKVIWDPDKRGV